MAELNVCFLLLQVLVSLKHISSCCWEVIVLAFSEQCVDKRRRIQLFFVWLFRSYLLYRLRCVTSWSAYLVNVWLDVDRIGRLHGSGGLIDRATGELVPVCTNGILQISFVFVTIYLIRN